MRIRTYSELIRLPTFDERFRYLALDGHVGSPTFGFNRWVNQHFYRSKEWRDVRQRVILRDDGCDLGILGHDIHTDIVVHHMNPITSEDIENGSSWILDPEFLITTTLNTHNAIHYSDESLLPKPLVERSRGDTKLW